ncbi:MAG TPA: hypothetical protein VFD58_20075 [Blastocatellia bacterium]|nr:hypothetical protein [Blastocatellia bacterium]
MTISTEPATAITVSQELRQTLVLRAWEAVSTQRELQGVLEAITQVLVPVVHFDSIGIIYFDGVNHDPYAAHIVGAPRRAGETLEQYFNRPEFACPTEIPVRPLTPYEPLHLEHANEGDIYVCNDLFAKEA